MNNKDIDKSIARAVNQAPTLNFEDLVNTPFIKMTEQDYITRQPEMHVVNRRRQLSVAFAFCFVILLSFTGWYVQNRVPDSVITLDVNPSIEIVTNKQDRIISIKALNEDAKKVIDEQTGKTTDLTLAVSSLLTKIINLGYLNTDKNAIMISVENKNQEKARELAISLEELIKISSTSQNITPEVLKQLITEDKDASELAVQYHLSVGKLKLIQQILSFDKTLTMDVLASMSIEELLDMSEERNVDLHEIIEFDDDYSEAENDDISSSEGDDEEDDSRTQNEIEKEKNSSQSDEEEYDNEQQEYVNDEEEKFEVSENKREDTEDQEDADSNDSTEGDSRGESDNSSGKNRDKSQNNSSKADSSDGSEDSSRAEEDESNYDSSQDDSTDIGDASSLEEDENDIRTRQGDFGDDREDTSEVNSDDNKNSSSEDDNDD